MMIRPSRLTLSRRLALGLLGALALSPAMAQTDNWPAKPIRMVVPFPAGGGTDIIAREVTQKMAATNKWTFVIDNKPGSGGNIGIDNAAKSSPDGYSLVIGQTSNLAINPSLYSKLPYDPVKDLTPIGLVGHAALVVVVATNSPFRNLGDVINAAKAQPGFVNYATSGNGTVAHLATELLQREANVKLTHIPYKGAAQGINDVMGGQVPLFFANVESLLGQVRHVLRHRPGWHTLILSLEESPDLDGTSVEALRDLCQDLDRAGQRVLLARLKRHAHEVLQRADLPATQLTVRSIDDAVKLAADRRGLEALERRAPLAD